MSRVSVMIPARNEPFLNRTVENVLATAAGDVEVLVLLDGAPPVEPLPLRSNLVVLSNDEPQGIGAAAWKMANAATGDYLMKLDAHCILAEGWDEALKADCYDDWCVIPARYYLNDETWGQGRGPIHYMYLTYPWLCEPQHGAGLHGKKWMGQSGLEGDYFWLEKRRKHILIDDIMTFQGSCWFMPRAHFFRIGGVDTRYWLFQEAQDIGMKTWLSGGRVVRNKQVWYAHLHKGMKHRRGYFMAKSRQKDDNCYSADFWMHDRWPGITPGQGIHWFVEHFWPIPGWPDDWDDPRYEANFVYQGPHSRKGSDNA